MLDKDKIFCSHLALVASNINHFKRRWVGALFQYFSSSKVKDMERLKHDQRARTWYFYFTFEIIHSKNDFDVDCSAASSLSPVWFTFYLLLSSLYFPASSLTVSILTLSLVIFLIVWHNPFIRIHMSRTGALYLIPNLGTANLYSQHDISFLFEIPEQYNIVSRNQIYLPSHAN